MIASAVAELAPVVGTRAACAALTVSRATHYRRTRGPRHGPPAPRPSPARALSEIERTTVLDVLQAGRPPARRSRDRQDALPPRPSPTTTRTARPSSRRSSTGRAFPTASARSVAARAFRGDFFTWYNTCHRHSGIALFSPADVHHGRAAEVLDARGQVLAGAVSVFGVAPVDLGAIDRQPRTPQ